MIHPSRLSLLFFFSSSHDKRKENHFHLRDPTERIQNKKKRERERTKERKRNTFGGEFFDSIFSSRLDSCDPSNAVQNIDSVCANSAAAVAFQVGIENKHSTKALERKAKALGSSGK